MEVNRAKIIKYIVVFLAAMLFFTVISNKVSYMMTPEITTVRPEYKNLVYEITANGRFAGGFVEFNVNMEKEPYIGVGDELAAEFTNIRERIWVTVEEKAFEAGSQSMKYTCAINGSSEANIYEGQNCRLRFSYDLGGYETVLPRECVVYENGAAFVYRTDTVKSVVGESDIVRRVQVDVEAEDDFNVAVTGGVSDWHDIARYSSKPLTDELKVRVAK